jgi:hypothetical protein
LGQDGVITQLLNIIAIVENVGIRGWWPCPWLTNLKVLCGNAQKSYCQTRNTNRSFKI